MRSDQIATLDLDLQFVDDLTAPGMAVSYTDALHSFDELHAQILCTTSHRLKISNYQAHRYDNVVRRKIACGTEVAVLRKARIVATKPK